MCVFLPPHLDIFMTVKLAETFGHMSLTKGKKKLVWTRMTNEHNKILFLHISDKLLLVVSRGGVAITQLQNALSDQFYCEWEKNCPAGLWWKAKTRLHFQGLCRWIVLNKTLRLLVEELSDGLWSMPWIFCPPVQRLLLEHANYWL